MCLLGLALHMREDLPLILVANRDEYYNRPTAPSHFWPPHYMVLAGKDLLQGGTWLGVTRDGRVCAVTNFREPLSSKLATPSRGMLVARFLSEDIPQEEFLLELSKRGSSYNGFNLIFGDLKALYWFSNRGGHQRLVKGIYALSNHLLDTPWPKVRRLKHCLEEAILEPLPRMKKFLLEFLEDTTVAPDEGLPDTGIGLEWERILSAVFVKSPNYGTRSSHFILFHKNGQVEFLERVYESGVFVGERVFTFHITAQRRS